MPFSQRFICALSEDTAFEAFLARPLPHHADTKPSRRPRAPHLVPVERPPRLVPPRTAVLPLHSTRSLWKRRLSQPLL
jgi:hypothetical protein